MLIETLALFAALVTGLMGVTWAGVGFVRQVHPEVDSYNTIQLILHFTITATLLSVSYLLFGVAF